MQSFHILRDLVDPHPIRDFIASMPAVVIVIGVAVIALAALTIVLVVRKHRNGGK